ncbi:SigE family RNA polymerase sigma factor [Actinoplanes sp. NEAU-A12]|uniref:SigE family RNA polymerase sigma factor n=1 Tax=Actinoplanes sandaracinus TaxID=3045177 RepID=A0ABT6WEK5_9ACTN|nr:SigE family RNA polymerase sigma factor [Actinoplanes sandaracinus]MDI6098161.1 SigE family RNA polymerase sigma factor [Actinoplanes sandaracinus]
MPERSDRDYLAFVHARVAELRRTAHLLCGDPHQADDFVQETLTKLYARWPRLGQVENVDAYVHTMLVRVFLDDRRRGWWKVRLLTGPPEPPPIERNPEDGPVVRAALAKLPPRQQAVLVLRYLCDKPVREVADLLRCSEGTVKSQTAHGLTRLRALLGVTALPPVAAVSQERR